MGTRVGTLPICLSVPTMTEGPGQGNQRTPPIWVLPCGSDGRALVRMPHCHVTPGACDDRDERPERDSSCDLSSRSLK